MALDGALADEQLLGDLGADDAHETAAYIATRVQVAGGDWTRLFTPSAIEAIHERSGGIPRIISVVCDNSLVAGFALDRCPVDSEIVLEVCRDLDLPGSDEPFGETTVLPFIDGSGA